jgi:cytochrome c nitrite reductase small subunit
VNAAGERKLLVANKTLLAWLAMLAVLTGAGGGIGVYTFLYAEGLSYFSDNPRECTNCHIMNDEYDSWLKSPHHTYANCNDCHTPHALLPKLICKADNGWNHSKKFTLGTWGDPIRIRPVNYQRMQNNCIRCHGDFVHDIRGAQVLKLADEAGEGVPLKQDIDCARCHGGVGHGPKR